MKALILAIIFTAHVAAFLRLYLKQPARMYYVLLAVGLFHLLAYYVYRTWAYYSHLAADLEWMSFLRWSGIAISALGTPPLITNMYSRIRTRIGHAIAPSEQGEADQT